MQRVGFLLKVKAELVDEYKRRHQEVWPDMLDALRRSGWRNYSLFMGDDGLLFGYFETSESFQAALAGMSDEAVNERWQAEMAPFFEGTGDHADEMMKELVEVFHLD
jgi:L-rhamnose mutarotase